MGRVLFRKKIWRNGKEFYLCNPNDEKTSAGQFLSYRSGCVSMRCVDIKAGKAVEKNLEKRFGGMKKSVTFATPTKTKGKRNSSLSVEGAENQGKTW